jgi:hypothetical protein
MQTPYSTLPFRNLAVSAAGIAGERNAVSAIRNRCRKSAHAVAKKLMFSGIFFHLANNSGANVSRVRSLLVICIWNLA